MATTMNRAQRRVINRLITRNIQGWGRPLSYTKQQLTLGGILFGTAIVLLVIDLALNGGASTFHPRTPLATLLALIIFFATAGAVFFLSVALPRYYTATSQPNQQFTGVINAVIGDVVDRYTFVTLRGSDGRLRAFALATALGDADEWHGKRVTLTVTPGIDEVTAIHILTN